MLEPLTCPQCKRRLLRTQLRDWECPFCHTDIGLAGSYQRCMGLLTLFSVLLLAVVTHKPASGGTWLFGVLLSALPAWVIFLTILPPWLKEGHNQPRLTIVSSWLGAAVTVFFVEFILFLAAYVLLGASQVELVEHLQILSMPLAWVSPNFLITPAKSFLDVCGVILGNSIFFGSLLYAFYQPVRWAFRRTRPTQLSISSTNPIEEDE